MNQASAARSTRPAPPAKGEHSLQAFLARLIWLCVLPLVLMAVYLAVGHVRTLLAQRDHDAAMQADQVARLVDRQLREQISVLQMMAVSPLLDEPRNLELFYKAAMNFREIFGSEVVLADPTSQMILNTRLPLGSPLPKLPVPRGHAAVPEALATGKPAVGDMFQGPVAKEPLVAVVVPVIRHGQTRLLLLSTVPTRLIQERMADLVFPIDGSITLLDGKQEVLAHWSTPDEPAPHDDQAPHRRYVAKSSLTPWSVVLEMHEDVFRAPIMATTAALVGAILLVTMVSLLGGRLTGRGLARAVASLAEGAAPSGGQMRITEIEAVRAILSETAAARREAESTQRESDRRFRQLFESAPVPLCFVDSRGVLTDFNRRFEQTFGYTHDDVPTIKQWWELAYPDPDYRRGVIRTWEEAVHRASRDKDDIKPREYQVTCKDGQERTMVISGITLGEDLLATFFDVTERQRAEAERARLFGQWQLALSAAQMGWWHYDPISKESSWDERYGEIFQVEGAQSPNEEILKRLHPEDLPRVWAAVEAALDPADPKPYFAQYRVNLPRGGQRWVEAHGLASFAGEGEAKRAVSFAGTVVDITERKQAELALYQSQAAMRGLLDATTDVVLLLDRDYRIMAANEVAAQSLGSTPTALRGRLLAEFLSEEALGQRKARFGEALASGRPVRFQDERAGRHFDNNYYPVTDAQGSIGAVAIYARDITQGVEDEKRRSALERQLLQSQKMEAVGTLAGGIAHDFNNILGVIIGYSEMALDDARQGKPAPRDMEQVMQAAERAKNLVKQILTFSRKVEVDMKPLDLNKEAAQAAQLLGKTIPKMIRIETDLAPDLKTVNANANQIEQILLNLGANAADAMPEGGSLRIRTENVMLHERSCHTCSAALSGPYVALSVADSGQGMDAQTMEHIFEPFYTTKGLGKGTGLGLSTVHGIVTGHAGHIFCESLPGQGTTFTIYFPTLEEQTAAGHSLEQTVVSPPGGSERVLLVDDEISLLQLGSRVLDQAGYKVWTASSGEQALQVYQTLDPRPDLVVMDLGMPGMGGRKALREMLAFAPPAKVVVASGYAANAQVQEALESGALGFVAKPYRRNELLTTVREALDRQ